MTGASTANKRFDLRLEAHAGDPEKKAVYTDALFSHVAPVYDSFTLGPMSFFQDIRWKEWLLDHLPEVPPGPALDLATGTGGISFMLAQRFPQRRITGVDINDTMLEIARRKNESGRVTFRKMNLDELDFDDESVALATGGYALRNAPDLYGLLDQVHRILMPGGVAAFIDFSRSSLRLQYLAARAGLIVWLSLWSLLLHRNLRIYTYIPASLRYFPDRDALGALFVEKGFSIVARKRFMMGIAEANILVKA